MYMSAWDYHCERTEMNTTTITVATIIYHSIFSLEALLYLTTRGTHHHYGRSEQNMVVTGRWRFQQRLIYENL